MGDLDFGMAMVAARIASSELGKDQEFRKNVEKKGPRHDPWKEPDRRNPSLPGVTMEVVNGEVVLLPAAGMPRHTRAKGCTLTRKDGSVIRIDTGQVVNPVAGRKNRRSQ